MSTEIPKFVFLPIFKDAVLKLQWARTHIEFFHRWEADYLKNGIKVHLEEPKAGEPHKMYSISTAPLHPGSLELPMGDIIRNLRGALDHAVSAVYRARGLSDKDAYFLFGNDRKNLEAAVKNRLKVAGLDKLAPFFLEEIRSTKEENYSLWSLSQVDNANKHRALTVIVSVAINPMPNFATDTGGLRFVYQDNWIGLEAGGVWNWLVPAEATLEDHLDPQPSLSVRFGPNEELAGQDVLPTLVDLHDLVLETLKKLNQAYILAFAP